MTVVCLGGPVDGQVVDMAVATPILSVNSQCPTHEAHNYTARYQRTDEIDSAGRPVYQFLDQD